MRNITYNKVHFRERLGFNPVFDEEFNFTVSWPELAFLEFVVKDQNFNVAGTNAKLGHFILPVSAVAEGTRS